jgi:hypothetical protein
MREVNEILDSEPTLKKYVKDVEANMKALEPKIASESATGLSRAIFVLSFKEIRVIMEEMERNKSSLSLAVQVHQS